jgi:hypothetical protein
MAGSSEIGNDPSDSINYGEFLDQLRKCGPLKSIMLHGVCELSVRFI